MVRILKISKYCVQILAILISSAFIINGLYGALNALKLSDGNMVLPDSIDPGDFEINYGNLSIDMGVTINNTSIYNVERIVVGMKYLVDPGNNTNYTLLDTNSVLLGQAETPQGTIIHAREAKRIGLNANMSHFIYTPDEIAIIFGLDSDWNMKDLIETTFKCYLEISFSIAYAFGQYKLNMLLNFNTNAIKEGFV